MQPIFYSQHLLAFNKPQGLASTPGKLEDITTKVFLAYPQLAQVKGYRDNEGGLLNRLDNETGGIILYADSNEAFDYYSSILKSKQAIKQYLAIVDKPPSESSGIITTPIAHHPSINKKMVAITGKKLKIRSQPQEAYTTWRLQKKFSSNKKEYAILNVTITKGVRHQIRVHLANTHMPILADKLYNPEKDDSMMHQLFCVAVTIPLLDGTQITIKQAADTAFGIVNI